MKIYLRNIFSSYMAISFKRCCVILTVILAGFNLDAANKKDSNVLPEFEGLNAIILNDGVMVHPRNLLVRFSEPENISKFKKLSEGIEVRVKKNYT